MKAKNLKANLSRPAIVMDIGGFRPPEDPMTSWFGKVLMALPEENWPTTNGQPMHALCQINLMELPYKPLHLDDLAMITVFIGPSELPINAANGTNWCLRAYRDLTHLCLLPQTRTGSQIKALPMRARLIKDDYPCLDDATDLGIDIADEDEYIEKYANADGLKLGGWPTLVQGPVSWNGINIADMKPEYVFQIDSSEKGRWQWGDNGIGYFGRGRASGYQDEWVLHWDCY